ncbi:MULTISPECIES: DUF1465 family protein [unclassified Thalassospira]|jgi:regulator of CtrA degradation|uniref:DUF1465 family protein n=1 Tax=unclassified Thalassospira TaxID=2648997 RepID=UPI000A1E3C2F|nr:DUF1465 family protein [Thalassospira sp. MCCC 1A01428]OSQ36201.1 hypothetical protein THS27_23700 [Thalassospira sp. MCCC 1A01428]
MTYDPPPLRGKSNYDSNFVIVPFSKTYDEALTLLVEARDYLSANRKRDRLDLLSDGAIAQFREEMRMTTRLIRSMAWLLSVRAVEAGEIDWSDAVDGDDLMVDIKICIQDDRDRCSTITPALLDLMDRAHSLYMRAARMELQVAARHRPAD